LNLPEAQLRKILELERRKGYADTAVVGGLDRFLKNLIQRDTLGPRSPVTESIMLLPTHGYASLSNEERRRWLAQTLQRMSGGAAQPTPVPTIQKARAKASQMRRQRAEIVAERTDAKSTLRRPVTVLKGVSTALASRLGRLGIGNVEDLLFFFPHRYNDFASIRPISQLIVGEEQTVIGTVWSAEDTPIGRRLRGTQALIGDETGTMRVVWFNQPYIAQQLRTNERVVLAGKVTLYKGMKTLENPEYEPLESEELLHTGRLVPVYHITTGLGARTVRRLVKQALDTYLPSVPELLPSQILSRNQMLPRSVAVRQMHVPDGWDELKAARRRLAFDELLLIQLGVLERKRAWQERGLAQPLRLPGAILDGYVRSLPFALTAAQQRALSETLADLSLERPMSRLLQGDVGSGKTVVGAAGLLAAVHSRTQGAMMAPTEILAEQHFRTLCQLFGCSERAASVATVRPDYLSRPLTIALLTGSLPASMKRELRKEIETGKVDIVVGTHAVIQEDVSFERLGLVVVDEQHRFGVMQRAALREKGRNPHVLVMTATPIPRTLTLTVYGDLDVSVIDEMPVGRKPVKTKWVSPDEREAAYQFVRRQVRDGYQAFIICPLIEESETLTVRAVTQEYERLRREVFPELRLGLVHGRLAGTKKENVMREFRDHALDILVSTAVVEVGVDIPNATVMMIEGAERFGLAQLHQLRGRVGRSGVQSYCLLLSESSSSQAGERLEIVERTQDGFELAEADLRLRGPGEFFGTRQSGLPDLKVARLSDVPLINLARQEASRLLAEDTDLSLAEHEQLRQEVSELWERVTAEAH
jgi:ATP-dependent DNA helicase RecG